MQVSPVKQYADLKYPTHDVVDEHPELLYLVPKRWCGNQKVLAALAGVGVLLTTCGANADKKTAPVTTPSKVAPIFVHGDGHGAFGCVAVNPPAFLSEDEARSVIIEEAKKVGINFKSDVLTLHRVEVPVTSLNPTAKTTEVVKGSVKLDGTDSKRKISFEYVSEADFGDWRPEDEVNPISVDSYDIRGAAAILRKGIAKVKANGAYAVFYDPCVGSRDGEGWGLAEDKQSNKKVESPQDQLRKQVRDFIKWLKAEGVI